jgi:prepilin-type N-terminal cleavage/methylation domain-containing protein
MLMVNKIQTVRYQGGFSLIELAVVLMIVGVLVGGIIGTLGSRIESSRYVENSAELETIKAALYGHAVSQGVFPHLPCPDCRTITCGALTAGNFQNDGLEDRDGAVCDAHTDGTLGNLPWRTLGVGERDPWGNRYSYWVSDTVTDNTATAFQLTSVLNSAQINTRTGENLSTLTDTAVAVVFTHGANGYGAITAEGKFRTNASSLDELENTNHDDVFVSRNITRTGAKTSGGDDFEFDDVLIWLSEYELKGKMVQAGVLP